MARKRISLAQNFFRDPGLVASIVAASSIAATDTVYEIGPGEGIITRELAKHAGRVVAIETDSQLVRQLKTRFRDNPDIEIVEADFLAFDIAEPDYKVFANIPFNITADIVRKLLFTDPSPSEAYLVMQKEAAERFSGTPNETEFSVLAKPWFDFNIVSRFRRGDFVPVPSVDVVLLHIEKRVSALVSSGNADIYRRFVKHGFESWRKNLKIAYKRVFTYAQWKRLSKDLGFPIQSTPTELAFGQWLGLFEYFMEGVSESKRMLILSSTR